MCSHGMIGLRACSTLPRPFAIRKLATAMFKTGAVSGALSRCANSAISTDEAPGALGPYSQAIRAGTTLYVSGQIGLVPSTMEFAGDSVEQQTTQVMENLRGVLKAGGASFADVVKTTVLLSDMGHFAAVNAIYVKTLPKNCLVEIEAIATLARAQGSSEPAQAAVSTTNAPGALGPYSQAISDGSTLYISGQIGLVPATMEFAGDSIEAQTKQVMENLGAILTEAGASFANVVKTTVLLSDMSNFAAVNTIYGSYFEGCTPPARACFAVKTLPKNCLVEIEAIAVKAST